jgi:hypothetical protein
VQLPFTTEQFFDALRAYNTTVWPAQVLLLALALAAVVLLFIHRNGSGAVISCILAALWAWMGLAYHLVFFAPINRLAYAFAAVSVMGSMVFLWQGVVRRRLKFEWSLNACSAVGLTLIVFALAGYPAWVSLSGHSYPALPTFGLPCPTTLFTIGLLTFARAPLARSALVVPVLWTFVGVQAAFLLDVQADLTLGIAGILGIVLIAKAGSSPSPAPAR